MRIRTLTSLAALALFIGGTASASPHTDLFWDGCVGPVQKAVLPGTIANLYVSVVGQTQPAQGYEVVLSVQTIGVLPDAWRFDPSGCQGNSQVSIDQKPTAAIAVTCPAFFDNAHSLQIKDYSYDPTSGAARITFANAFANVGNPPNSVVPDPTQRYFLVHIGLDETYGVTGAGHPFDTCGGLEKPVCIWISQNSWNDASATIYPWDFSTRSVLANDPTDVTRCPGFVPVDSRMSTWGQVKSLYR